MPGKKKFIDKKKAQHFHLLHRSQLDPLYHLPSEHGGSQMVLQPANANAEQAMREATHPLLDIQVSSDTNAVVDDELREIDENGMPVDGYNYNQHMANVSGGGVFIGKDGKVKEKKVEGKAFTKNMFESEEKLERMLEAITLNENTITPEIRAMLDEELSDAETVGEDDDEKEDKIFNRYNNDPETLLDDDFVTQLVAKEKESAEDAFDFDAHVKRLMEQAEAEDAGDDFEDDELSSIEDINPPRVKRDIDDEFEKFMEEEYLDDELYSSDGDNQDLIEENEKSNTEKPPEIIDRFMGNHFKEMGGLRSVSLKPSQKASLDEVEAQDAITHKIALEKTKQMIENDLLAPELDLTKDDPVEALRSMIPAYRYKAKPKHNCQTILSTYSVTMNHPKTFSIVTASQRQRQNKKERETKARETVPEEDDSEEDNLYQEPVLFEKRPKQETKEEKRERKQRIKELQRLKREKKKQLKVRFAEEKKTQNRHRQGRKEAAVPPEGVTAFRI